MKRTSTVFLLRKQIKIKLKWIKLIFFIKIQNKEKLVEKKRIIIERYNKKKDNLDF
jgi:hypothetical protein